MIRVGQYNTLPVLKVSQKGALLGTNEDHAFLPASKMPEDLDEGDEIEVFVYTDSEGVIATTEKPEGVVGDFLLLEVVDVNEVGAFLDWGLGKDLFVPFGRQFRKLEVGDEVVVAISLDNQGRVMASSTLSGNFDDDVSGLHPNMEVDLLVYGFSEHGAQVVVNNKHAGLVYHNWIYRKLHRGDRLKGYIAEVREDHRLDVMLRRPGQAGADAAQQTILDALQEAEDGFLPYHDKSSPDAIRKAFKMSKKVFKKAIGGLYKDRIIEIERGRGIKLS